MSQIKTTILEEQEFSRKEIEAMPEPETVDPNIEVEREKDEEHSEAMAQAEHNFTNSL
jgi:hypothetical protein